MDNNKWLNRFIFLGINFLVVLVLFVGELLLRIRQLGLGPELSDFVATHTLAIVLGTLWVCAAGSLLVSFTTLVGVFIGAMIHGAIYALVETCATYEVELGALVGGVIGSAICYLPAHPYGAVIQAGVSYLLLRRVVKGTRFEKEQQSP